jgi:hypothetical protein
MNNTIWKFGFNQSSEILIDMPKGAQILALQTIGEAPFIWALVDPEAENEERHFELYGTGHTIIVEESVMKKYIGTFHLYGGKLVFHLFERINQ